MKTSKKLFLSLTALLLFSISSNTMALACFVTCNPDNTCTGNVNTSQGCTSEGIKNNCTKLCGMRSCEANPNGGSEWCCDVGLWACDNRYGLVDDLNELEDEFDEKNFSEE